MGLDTNHNCFHGAYSAFSRWRDRLTELAGLDEKVLNGLVTADTVRGKWKKRNPPADVLHVLLLHSDCDGKIPHRFCKPLAKRLDELRRIDDDDWSRTTTAQFIDGLLSAHKAGDGIYFS
jgi:hypothetical protein